jgi:hypothetical protein
MYTELELALADQIMLAFALDIKHDAQQGGERACMVRAAHAWMRTVETQGARADFMEKFRRYLDVSPRIRDEYQIMSMVMEISEANGAALVGETKTSA